MSTFDPLASPCLWCDYRGEGYWQRGTHTRGCPWFHLGGEEARREALRVVIAGTVAEGEGLAAEREKRLKAELAAEQLREALRDLVATCEFGPGESPDDAAAAHERALAALSAPPPSLEPLRELVLAAGSMEIRRETVTPSADPAVRRLKSAAAAVLALYPFLLGEAEGEVER